MYRTFSYHGLESDVYKRARHWRNDFVGETTSKASQINCNYYKIKTILVTMIRFPTLYLNSDFLQLKQSLLYISQAGSLKLKKVLKMRLFAYVTQAPVSNWLAMTWLS